MTLSAITFALLVFLNDLIDARTYYSNLNNTLIADDCILHIIPQTFVGNIGRYANHSCAPNLTMHPVRSELASVPHLALFANRQDRVYS